MKNRYFLILPIFAAAISLQSCEDAIDLDLGPPVSQIVIDAVIDQTTDSQFIYISKTIAYLSDQSLPGYEIDSIGILDTQKGVFHRFQSLGNGKYFFVPPAPSTFEYGKTYQLLAQDGNDIYVSQSTLFAPVTIDSFTYKYEENGRFGGSKGNYITLWAKDKPGKGDYYWFRLFRNDSLQAKPSDIILAIDNAFNEESPGDGDLFIIPIRENFSSRPFLKGEKARIEVLSVPREMYYYLSLISTQLNNQGLFAVPPSNVPGNIICINNPGKKILGFFAMTGKAETPELLIP